MADSIGVDLQPSEFGGTNYAVGGHTTIDVLASITADTPYLQYSNLVPGKTFSSLFYNLRQNNQSLDPNALYLLHGGPNDLRVGISNRPADAARQAQNVVDAANVLGDNGAKYVAIVNIIDIGIFPFAASRGLDEVVSRVISAGNAALAAGAAASSNNIAVLDAFTLSDEVAADPASFGFNVSYRELTTTCFENSIGCLPSTTGADIDSANPDPNQFFFSDSAHPSTYGHRIVADYKLSVLNASSELAMLPSLAIDSVQSQWQAARPNMRDNRWGSKLGDGPDRFSVYGTLQQSENNQDTLISGLKGKNEAQSYHVGVNYHATNDVYFGVLLGRSDNELNLNASKYKMKSTDISLLGSVNKGSYFAEAILTYSDNDYHELNRSFNLGPFLQRTETGDTDGDATSLAIQAGYDVFKGEKNYRLGPIVGYEYIDTTVDGYQEENSLSTSLVIGKQEVSSSVLLAGVFANIGLGVCDCEAYAEIVYRDETDNDRNDVELGLVTIADNRFTLPGHERDDSFVSVDLGFTAALTDTVDLNISAGSMDASDSDNMWYGATVSLDL